MPTELVTARLLLTPLRAEDAPEMVVVLADPRMYEFTGGQPPTLEALRDRYERLADGRSPDGSEWWWNWIVRLDGTAVGVVQATVAADGTTADVAWEVGIEWQGRGMAGEAAGAMVRWLLDQGVAEIRALVHPDHAASAGVAARIGLTRTAEREDGEVVWRRRTLEPAVLEVEVL